MAPISLFRLNFVMSKLYVRETLSETASLSTSVQDYVKELYKLQAGGRASTSALAGRMGVAPASATAMLKKLAQLGLPREAVHAEADRLEHALSEELEALIDASLGFPTHDPHGDPIPSASLELDLAPERSLADVEVGSSATVSRVPDTDRELLRYLGELGLVPGARVAVRTQQPFGGPVVVRAGGADHPIARELAARIGVE